VKEKETAIFSCELNKDNAHVKWFKAGNEINSNDIKYRIVAEKYKYSLHVIECEIEDMNDYTISFRNKKSTAQLIIDGLLYI
jgi:hypothetical protein